MITKAEIQSINGAGNRCIVRMPLFETAASSYPVTAEALVCIPPGIYGNLEIGDIVLVAFEENALEKPIIIGKLFKGSGFEKNVQSGMGIFNELLARTAATVPHTTKFKYPSNLADNYKYLDSPYDIADYIKWLEKYTKDSITTLEKYFNCFKKWAQYQLQPENVEIDDGDLDDATSIINKPFLYQNEGATCKICSTCTNSNQQKTRKYPTIDKDTTYKTNHA